MVNVRDLIAGYEARHAQQLVELVQAGMSPRLRRFLDMVWEHRNDQDLDIYSLYVGGRPHAIVERPLEEVLPDQHRDLVTDFVARLSQIGKEPRIQAYGEALARVITHRQVFAADESLAGLANAAVVTRRPWILRDLGHSFFHFPKMNRASPARRVYVNVSAAFRGAFTFDLYRPVVRKMHGVTNAKVAGPLSLGYDTVVIYCEDDETVDKVLDWLAKYQPLNAYFEAPTIEIARQVNWHKGQRLRGVATAMEPRAHTEPRGGGAPSFGDFWEMLIEEVLAQNPPSHEEFVKQLLWKVREFGIDPRHPEV